MKYKFIDLFAGCGGLEDGFLQSGKFVDIAAVEWLKPQVNTLRERLKTKWNISDADSRVLNFDLQEENELFNGWNDKKYGESKGLDYFVKKSNGIDVIIGGPPCQAYSIAGRVRDEHGMQDDYRNFLFEHYLSIVNRYRPKAFIFENVTGILSAAPGGVPITKLIKKGFEDIGYAISQNLRGAVLNSADFGVPQNRNRVIILGVRKDNDGADYQKLISKFYSYYIRKYTVNVKMTVGDAIGDLPPIYPIDDEKKAYTEPDTTISWHRARYQNKRDKEIFYTLAKDIETGENKYTSSEALSKIYEQKIGAKSPIHRYHVLRKDQPSTTIIAHLYKDGNRFIHYDSSQSRTITPREAARLQSFDDDFEFLGSRGSVYQMIGNAVPPKFAKCIALALYDFLENEVK